MITQSFEGRVPNALVLLTGVDDPEIPLAFSEEPTIATSSCIAIAASGELPVRVRFVPAGADSPGIPPLLVHEGTLPVTNGQLAILNVLGELLAAIGSQGPISRVRVFVDDLTEPVDIAVAL